MLPAVHAVAGCPLPQSAPWALLLALMIAHFLCDYPLQGSFLAKAKNRHSRPAPDSGFHSPWLWVHALTAHSFIHGGAVWLVTGCVWFALAEIVLHWIIDFAKCEGWCSYHTDQLLHLACKVAYVVLLCRVMQ